jgi:hypothetical protein
MPTQKSPLPAGITTMPGRIWPSSSLKNGNPYGCLLSQSASLATMTAMSGSTPNRRLK